MWLIDEAKGNVEMKWEHDTIAALRGEVFHDIRLQQSSETVARKLKARFEHHEDVDLEFLIRAIISRFPICHPNHQIILFRNIRKPLAVSTWIIVHEHVKKLREWVSKDIRGDINSQLRGLFIVRRNKTSRHVNVLVGWWKLRQLNGSSNSEHLPIRNLAQIALAVRVDDLGRIPVHSADRKLMRRAR